MFSRADALEDRRLYSENEQWLMFSLSFDVGKFNDKSETDVLFGVRKVCFADLFSPRMSCQPTGTGAICRLTLILTLEQREFDCVINFLTLKANRRHTCPQGSGINSSKI